MPDREMYFKWKKVVKRTCSVFLFCGSCVLLLHYFRYQRDPECYPRIGCFVDSAPWNERVRPFNFFPDSPSVINTSFTLTSGKPGQRETRTVLFPIDLSQVNDFKWGEEDLVVVIVHGYAPKSKNWIESLREIFLSFGDVTVILVDWRSGAAGYYPQVVANTRVVAREIARLVGHISQNVSFPIPKRFHIIGHSLGAQIASYAGKNIKASLAPIYQITALDPAFHLFEDYSQDIRLHRDDAQHVLVIHSNIGPWGLGMRRPVGTVDIYLNDGVDQRGCVQISELISRPLNLRNKNLSFEGLLNIKLLLSCSHRRAHDLLDDILQSLNKSHSSDHGDFVAYPMIIPEESEVDPVQKKISLCQNEQEGCWRLTWNPTDFFFHLPQLNQPRFANQSLSFFMPTTDKSPFCAQAALLEIFTCPFSHPLQLQNSYSVSIAYRTFQDKMKIFKGKVSGSQKIKAWIDLSCESIQNDFKATNGKVNITLSVSYKEEIESSWDTAKFSDLSQEASETFCWATTETRLTYYNPAINQLTKLKPCALHIPNTTHSQETQRSESHSNRSCLAVEFSGLIRNTKHPFKLKFS